MHVNRSNPDCLPNQDPKMEMEINGKTYKGVFVLGGGQGDAKEYEPGGTYSVMPYDINQVIRSNGKLKQNPGYASKF